MNLKNLAIVIPAYKKEFFSQALESIANQTCKDFNVYIGDDASPEDLYSDVKLFENRIPIVYKRFEYNIGGKNLALQWNRCVDLINDENWIWLFSDDDIMEPNCVELFFKELDKKPVYDLYHFDINIIDEKNLKKVVPAGYPIHMDVFDFYKNRCQGKIYSFVVEYIFHKDRFKQAGGFQEFDLAWNSDDATWIKLGAGKGIKTIKNGKVLWRKSNINITSAVGDKNTLIRKILANLEYSRWIMENKDLLFPGINTQKVQALRQSAKLQFKNKLPLQNNKLSFSEKLNFLNEYDNQLHKVNSSFNNLTGLVTRTIYAWLLEIKSRFGK